MEFIDDLGDVKPIPDHAVEAFRGTMYSVWQWDQELYDGTTTTFEALKRASTAHTVGVLSDGQILLIEDEQPGRGIVLTPSGGRIEAEESPEVAARREFLEETGYTIGELVSWHYYRVSTRVDSYVYAYIGRNLQKNQEPNLEAGERVRCRLFSFDEFLQLGHTPLLRDRILRTLLLGALVDPVQKARLHELLYGTIPQ